MTNWLVVHIAQVKNLKRTLNWFLSTSSLMFTVIYIMFSWEWKTHSWPILHICHLPPQARFFNQVFSTKIFSHPNKLSMCPWRIQDIQFLALIWNICAGHNLSSTDTVFGVCDRYEYCSDPRLRSLSHIIFNWVLQLAFSRVQLWSFTAELRICKDSNTKLTQLVTPRGFIHTLCELTQHFPCNA